MLDASHSPCDYAARVADEVAARYGLAVSPAVVQRVPPGTSGLPQVVWDGKHLVLAEHQGKEAGAAWRNRHKTPAAHRQGLVDPKVQDRRKRVVDLHATGATDYQMADTLAVDVRVIRVDRKALRLRANVNVQRGPSTQSEIRIARIRQMIADGVEREMMCAHLGVADGALRYLARQGRLTLPPSLKRVDLVAAQRIARLRELVAAGASRAEMTADLGVAIKTLRGLAERAGLVLPPPTLSVGRASADCAPIGPKAYPARDARHAAIRALPVAEMTVDQIVAALGGAEDPRRVRADLRHMGLVPRRKAGFGTVDMRAARLAKIAALPVAEMTVAEIAARLGVSLKAVYVDLEKLGLQPLRLETGKSRAQVSAMDDRRARITALVAEGKTRNEIMAAEGIGPGSLYNHLKALGIDLPRADAKRVIAAGAQAKHLMDDLRERIRALRLEGKTLAAIGALVGRSTGTVNFHLLHLGMTTKRGAK